MLAYLLHFERPYKHARHYIGSTNDLARRLQEHASGIPNQASALMVAVHDAGIPWRLARTWECTGGRNGRGTEFKLKKRGGRASMCPLCGHGRRVAMMRDVRGGELYAGDSVVFASTRAGRLALVSGSVELVAPGFALVRPSAGRRALRRITDSARIAKVMSTGQTSPLWNATDSLRAARYQQAHEGQEA